MLEVWERVAGPRCVLEDGKEAFHVMAHDVEWLLEGSVRVWSPGDFVEVAAGRVYARRTAADTFWLLHYGTRLDGGRERLQVAEREVRRHELVPAVAMALRQNDIGAAARLDVPRFHPIRAYRADLQELHVKALLAFGYAGLAAGRRSWVWLDRRGSRRSTFEWHVAALAKEGTGCPHVVPWFATRGAHIVQAVRCSGCAGALLPGVQRLAWQQLGIDPQGDEAPEPPF